MGGLWEMGWGRRGLWWEGYWENIKGKDHEVRGRVERVLDDG